MRWPIALHVNFVPLLFITSNVLLMTLTVARNISVDLDILKRRLIKEQEAMNSAVPSGHRSFYLMHPVAEQKRLEDLKGKTLRVIIPKIEPPYVNYINMSQAYEQERGFGPGVVMEILRQVAVELNLTYEIVYHPDEEWGTLDNGTWTGAFGELVRGNADIIAGAAIMQYDRSVASDLTYPFQFEKTGILIRSPDQYTDNTFLIVTEPFKLEVWGLTAATIIVSAATLKLISRCLFHQMEVQFSLLQCIWIFFSVFVQQGIPIQPTSWSSRSLLALWWLASVTLLATFTGSLVALFAVDRNNFPFQDFSEMVQAVKNGKYKLVMDGNSQTRVEMIARSHLSIYQELWYEMLKNNRVTYVDGLAEGIELVKKESGYALLGAMDSLKINAISNCNVVLLADGVLPTYLTIPLQLHSPYSNYFSNRIRQMVEGGFIAKWINDYSAWVASQHHNRCDNTTVTRTSSNQKGILNLDKAQGAFWIFLSGIALALLTLLFEHLCTYIVKIVTVR
uniref:Lig_chan-Glu_bd domain-containing protein n=1 Tax=Steinernema glaseri TaxID=37863 RepID=A0A1I7Z4E8_9BILA